MTRVEAGLYQAPFEVAEQGVRPVRSANRRQAYRERWWLHVEPRSEIRDALAGLRRFIVTVRHAKHRIFAWVPAGTIPDSALIVFARDDDHTFGILHSRAHEIWARALGTQVRDVESGFRYTPTTTFETFPFPRPTDEQRAIDAAVAARLDELRRGWLDPAGMADEERQLRTLTNLYNELPAWLRDVHRRLDEAVLAAYGWTADISSRSDTADSTPIRSPIPRRSDHPFHGDPISRSTGFRSLPREAGRPSSSWPSWVPAAGVPLARGPR